MYKVVLVEDEPWTLLGISKTFKWNEMGFKVINQTTRAMDAIDIILDNNPDVVFTDIRMPQISGIELMRKIRNEDRDTEFVIISGFAEFEYARDAITLGAFEYCLKPISKDAADSILERLKEHLDKKRNITNVNSVNKIMDVENKIHNVNFKNLLNYINENFKKNLQLKDLADQFYLNPNYCCYLFKNLTGNSFSEYLTSKRMGRACKLLKDTTLTISEVAAEAGYNDYYYFNKTFKRQFSCTPSQYRKDWN
ncbi:MAG TPA: response regulator [Clostridiales bacterium]|nr:response regulator [Clostridiales bacterium]